ncbi:DUF4349 domain-containing protein [Metallumcola ferriviriculae]|uniref:Anti-sigma-W factor RsiW n=1 Tax=Metallumcola ferriviriculae TaxID=3039180 RepID=A0AAU0UND7_9FIRM|nr:DUF4349 domain-containing protein [Desulfitibacteraceae bacterium MK1]
MACEKFQEMLSAYLDQALNPADVELLEAHLEECEQCRQELADLKDTVTMLRSMAEIEPPAEFKQQLRERLQAEKQQVKNQSPSLMRRVIRSPWLPLSAAAALFFVFIGVFGISFWLQPMGRSADTAKQEQSVAPEMGFDEQNKSAAPMEYADDAEFDQPEIARDQGQLESQDMKIAGSAAGIAKEEALPPAAVKYEQRVERKVVRRASFTLEVKDVPGAEQSLRQSVEKFGGYVESANMQKQTEDRYFANLTLRVPQDSFNQMLDDIKKLGEVRDTSFNGDDVTRQYYDTQARLKVMREEEESLLEVLDKASKIEDIMQVRRELSRVRQEIESLDSQLKNLSQMADLATINVSLRTEDVPKNTISTTGMGGVWSRTMQAFVLSTNRLIRGLGETLIGVGALLPILILLAALILFVAAIVRFRRQSKSE